MQVFHQRMHKFPKRLVYGSVIMDKYSRVNFKIVSFVDKYNVKFHTHIKNRMNSDTLTFLHSHEKSEQK